VGAVASLIYAWPRGWQAYGGDVPALLPASAIALLPVIAVVLAQWGYGGLLAASAVTFAAGVVIESLPPVALGVLVILPVAATVYHSLTTKGMNDEQPNE